jgi:hypothetical protein
VTGDGEKGKEQKGSGRLKKKKRRKRECFSQCGK